MPVRYEFTPEQEALLRDPSNSQRDLAARFGCSEMPIRNWRRRHDVAAADSRATRRSAAPTIADQDAGPSNEELLRDEVAQLRRQLRRTDKTSLGDERVLRAIESACERVEPAPPPKTYRLSDVDSSRRSPPHHRHAAIWSDWHAGEVVDKSQMNGLNEFSWPILEARVDQLATSMLAFKRVSPELTGLDIWALGDMASGAIHGLEETNDRPAAEQFVEVGYVMARAIERLSPHYADISCAGIVGNHPRPGKEPASKDAYNNGDWIAYHIARAATAHLSNVSWEIPKGGMIVRRFAGRNFLLWHGDGVRSSMPGVPWGGIARRVNVLKDTYAERGTRIDFVVVGHFHQRSIVPSVYMNGSLVGPNEYGIKNFGGGEAPKQIILEFDEKRCRETAVKTVSFESVSA